MKNLQLSLKKQWFEITKSGVKTEDYREITPYWMRRLLYINLSQEHIESGVLDEFLIDLALINTDKKRHESVSDCLLYFNSKFKKFEANIMTLGYPKSTDSTRILKLEHKGIEIREGNPEWGAEKGKLYFVIKHGNFLNN